MPGPQSDTDPVDGRVTAEQYGAALTHPTRRNVLFHLKRERSASFEHLVDVALTTTITPTTVDPDELRRSVENGLFHLHLPKLVLLDVVHWDREADEIALLAYPDRLGEWLDLPLAESVHGATCTPPPALLGTADHIRVLFVEDFEPLADTVVDTFALDHEDIEVTTASNATEALEALASESFDCIVSDNDMPGTSGLGFLKAVRRVNDDVPFLIYTGKGTKAIEDAASEHDTTGYLHRRGTAGQFDLLADRIRTVVSNVDAHGSAASP